MSSFCLVLGVYGCKGVCNAAVLQQCTVLQQKPGYSLCCHQQMYFYLFNFSVVPHVNEGVCVFFRHWEAIKKWDEAIHLSPEDPVLYEMKSQVRSITFLLCASIIKGPFHLLYSKGLRFQVHPQTPPRRSIVIKV